MKNGLTISAIGHAAFLAWGIVSFAATPLERKPIESAPVDIISENEFNSITAGVKSAPKLEASKPQVEKVAPRNEVKDLAAKVADKPEIDNSVEAPPPPPMPEPKPKLKVAEAKPPEPKEKLEKKPDSIAETIKQDKPDEKPEKDEAAKQQAKVEIPTPPKRPPRPQPKPEPKPEAQYDPNNIQALLDKRKPQRHAAAGDVINPIPALGVATNRQSPLKMSTSSNGRLSDGEKNALMGQIAKCWSPPAGAADAKDQRPVIRVELSQDGRVIGEPQWIEGTAGATARIAAEAAIRAIRRCQPYNTVLSAAKYDEWRVVEAEFDPSLLFR